MTGIIGWRRFSAVILSILLVAGIESFKATGIGNNAVTGILGILGIYMTGSTVAKIGKGAGQDA